MSPANPATTLSTLPQIPLSAEPYAQIARLVEGLDSAGLWWLSGYTAGLARAQATSAPPTSVGANTDSAERTRLTVVYGSQTGNARRVAEALVAKLEADGLPVRLLRADAYPTRELKDERFLAIVISTQGDGDPPDDARALVEFIDGKRAPQLPQLRFAVLGLGDSSYPQVCLTSRKLDARLAELGGKRVLALGEADVDKVGGKGVGQAVSAAFFVGSTGTIGPAVLHDDGDSHAGCPYAEGFVVGAGWAGGVPSLAGRSDVRLCQERSCSMT